MANWANQFGIVVKQGEDEITVAQMALGSMFMGTRALAATSGGGFDLMTETVSLAGMIECPLVIIIAQRPGPATGLPTWTAQADLNLAIHAGHGEFARIVMAVSDPTSAFDLIQHAFNLAEEFQTPVLLLTEKTIAEAQETVETFRQNAVPIKRGLVPADKLNMLKSVDRYQITKTGVSKRWIPGSSPAFYYANSDEHWESGVLTEDGKKTAAMIEKRMKKLKSIEDALPEPVEYGPAKADISFVGWGSSKGVMLDAIEYLKSSHHHNEPHGPNLPDPAGQADELNEPSSVNYLHFDYLWPLKTKTLIKFFEQNKNVHLIEGNFQGQLGNLIEGHTGLKFKGRLLKWDGRPFFLEEVIKYRGGITNHELRITGGN
jgi:2-oxoglutarate ferredoxin oxidoreductase subunit alpha